MDFDYGEIGDKLWGEMSLEEMDAYWILKIPHRDLQAAFLRDKRLGIFMKIFLLYINI